ncbi:acid sphingomyelinase-like phosphodiesterase 3a isoform X2 [Heteronotia binoei]|uniref:acid sphingomyelinase-like phosphodiesterase 3a isoform X2 n=1 Tax=Heteronotia binoei TaxID=13085 RepID=UPI002931313C|nr:acid sphingomyelinase-like phosphodiesterase 3a isoform X2 [Heteronotia binoei]
MRQPDSALKPGNMEGTRGSRGVTLSLWGLLLLWNAMQDLVSSAPARASPQMPFGAGQFWHITDLHLDPTYHITINRTQVCASSKGKNASSPGLFGDFMCDSPYKLILSALKYMKDSGQQASFMIWTGDSPPHVPVKELSTKMVIDIIGNMTSTIRSFFPELQVFPALGNHDYWPQVYVIGHVPVGYLPFVRNTTAIREYYNERLIEIFRRYSSVISGQFFGHTHRDSIMILLDKKGKPVNSLFVAPAVTPVKSLWQVDSNNPGVRLYQYDSLSYSVLDLWQFYLNLTEANMKNVSDWRLEYVMTKAYGIEDLKPENLHGMVKQLSAPHSKLFAKYYNNYFVSYDGNKFCEQHCRVSQLCAIQYLDLPSYTDCIGNEDTSQYE